jgi:hypothetical protein
LHHTGLLENLMSVDLGSGVKPSPRSTQSFPRGVAPGPTMQRTSAPVFPRTPHANSPQFAVGGRRSPMGGGTIGTGAPMGGGTLGIGAPVGMRSGSPSFGAVGNMGLNPNTSSTTSSSSNLIDDPFAALGRTSDPPPPLPSSQPPQPQARKSNWETFD